MLNTYKHKPLPIPLHLSKPTHIIKSHTSKSINSQIYSKLQKNNPQINPLIKTQLIKNNPIINNLFSTKKYSIQQQNKLKITQRIRSNVRSQTSQSHSNNKSVYSSQVQQKNNKFNIMQQSQLGISINPVIGIDVFQNLLTSSKGKSQKMKDKQNERQMQNSDIKQKQSNRKFRAQRMKTQYIEANKKIKQNTNYNQSQRSVKNTTKLSTQQTKFLSQIKQLQKYFTQQTLFNRLSVYSKQATKSSLRVYKQDLQKIIIQRYGKDRATPFLQTQYIEDYGSIHKTIQQLLQFTKQQVLVFIFLIMDQDRDALITPQDLVNFTGAKNQQISMNYLIMQDLNKIMNYIKTRKFIRKSTVDLPSNQYQYIGDQGFNLMKYRICNMEKAKRIKNRDCILRRNKLLSINLRQQLYTLQIECEQDKRNNRNDRNNRQQKKMDSNFSNLINFILSNNNNQVKQSKVGPQYFAINFETFKQIFIQKVPRTFIDFLYLYGGIKSPKYCYTPIDGSVLIKNNVVITEVEEQLSIIKFKKRLQQMKAFNQISSLVYHTIL